MYILSSEGKQSELVPDRRLSGSYFGEAQAVSPAPSLNFKRAVAQNKHYEKELKWGSQVVNIRSFLTRTLGVASIVTPEDFAKAVATWQGRFGGEKKPDGVIGPTTWSKLQIAMRATNPPPVSPSQVSDIPNAEKDPKWLALGIFEAEFITLEAWQSALFQFGEVMKSVSDKEGSANFGGVLKRLIQDKLLDTIVKNSPLVGQAKQVLDALAAENRRAEQVREAAQLRDFIVNFHRRLTDARVELSSRKDDYYQAVERIFVMGTEEAKRAYKQRLVEYLDRLDQMRIDGWLNGKHLFYRLAIEWIRNTKWKNPGDYQLEESSIRTWVDPQENITKSRIWAPGGQKIAEQLLKDAGGGGLRLYAMPVRRLIIYYATNGYPMAYSRLTAQGGHERIHPGENDVSADIKLKRLLARQPTTKDVGGG